MKTIFDRIVLLLVGVALILDGLALVDFLLHPLAADFTYHSAIYRAVVILGLVPLTLLVGFLIMRRVPGNIVGPLLIVWSGTVAYGSLRPEIGLFPFGLFALYEVAVGWSALSLMLLHFPNGKIYPPGAARWLYSIFGILLLLGSFVNMSHATNYGVVNPLFVPALSNYENLILLLMIVLGSFILVMAPVSLVLRYRRGSFQERQQLKWLALFGAILAAGTLLGFFVYPLITGGEMFTRENTLFSLLFFLSMSLFPPLAIGVAVLRHHLWDIDLIIRRTLVYSILTVVLTLIYFGSVVGLQAFFTKIIGRQSPAATVISTLAIFILFTPLRRYIQTLIDRRFYRQKYNAERVMADFSTILREKVDLDHLTTSILGVVEETMQPDHISLWLREVDFQRSERQAKENAT